jgi:hypothetical protein
MPTSDRSTSPRNCRFEPTVSNESANGLAGKLCYPRANGGASGRCRVVEAWQEQVPALSRGLASGSCLPASGRKRSAIDEPGAGLSGGTMANRGYAE